MRYFLRLSFWGAFLLFSSAALAIDCSPHLVKIDDDDTPAPLKKIVHQIKETIRDKSSASYALLAQQLREFRKTVKDELWVIEDDQEGRYQYFIAFAHTLNKKTIYAPVLEEVDKLVMAYSKTQETLAMLDGLYYIDDQVYAQTLRTVIDRIDDELKTVPRTLQYFYQVKDYETKYFRRDIADAAIKYKFFSPTDWGFLNNKISDIPKQIANGRRQLEQLKNAIHNRCPAPTSN